MRSKDNTFANPALLPLRPVSTIATPSALIVAPHPDDETLGCGGAIALLRQSGCDVRVLVVSDGTRSHPHSISYPPPRLRAVRAAETLEALLMLGVDRSHTTFFNLPDGAIPTGDDAEFRAAIDRCHVLLQTLMPTLIFLPWRFDPHPDHRAAWTLIRTALSEMQWTGRILEYPIWDWDPEQRGNLPDSIVSWRLDIDSVRTMKQNAIAAYRSQTTNLIDDDPTAFRLTPEMLSNFAQPWELYLEEVQ